MEMDVTVKDEIKIKSESILSNESSSIPSIRPVTTPIANSGATSTTPSITSTSTPQPQPQPQPRTRAVTMTMNPPKHCSFCLMAEFDIDKGSTLSFQYPNPIQHDNQ